MKRLKANDIAVLGILIAVMIVIQVISQVIYAFWPMPLKPTLLQIPVAVGAILLGWRKGAFLGFFMGFLSFLTATLITLPNSFLFSPLQPVPNTDHGSLLALVIAFIPRLLVGIVPYFVYQVVKGKIGAGLAGFMAALTNTIFVLTSIYLFFGQVLGWSFKVVLTTILATNTLFELVVTTLALVFIVPVLEKVRS